MSPRVTLQIERVVESFPTERAEVAFDCAVAFYVTIEEPLQGELLLADFADEAVLSFLNYRRQPSISHSDYKRLVIDADVAKPCEIESTNLNRSTSL